MATAAERTDLHLPPVQGQHRPVLSRVPGATTDRPGPGAASASGATDPRGHSRGRLQGPDPLRPGVQEDPGPASPGVPSGGSRRAFVEGGSSRRSIRPHLRGLRSSSGDETHCPIANIFRRAGVQTGGEDSEGHVHPRSVSIGYMAVCRRVLCTGEGGPTCRRFHVSPGPWHSAPP